jgi:hypothetical protein
MSGINEAIRMASFVKQMDAGRSPAVAGMVVAAMFPFDQLGGDWPGPWKNRRKVKKLARSVAANANPAKGWTDTMLLGLLETAFMAYGSVCRYESREQQYWVCHVMWVKDPEKDIKELLASIGMS